MKQAQLNALQKLYTIEEIDENIIQIEVPYQNYLNDNITFYLDQFDDEILITDDGWALNEWEIKLGTPIIINGETKFIIPQQINEHIINIICNQYKMHRNETNELYLHSDDQSLLTDIITFTKGLVALNKALELQIKQK